MNKSTIITIVVLVLLVILGIYWYMPYNNTYNAPVVPAPAEQAAPAPDATINSTEVSIVDYKFNPTPLTIKAGTKVTWTNNDTVPHTVTSDSGTTLNSPRLNPGQTFSYTFTTAGSYDYHCAVHPMMKGSVIVQ